MPTVRYATAHFDHLPVAILCKPSWLEGKRFPQKPEGASDPQGRRAQWRNVLLRAPGRGGLRCAIHPTIGEAVDRLECPLSEFALCRQNDGVTASALNKE